MSSSQREGYMIMMEMELHGRGRSVESVVRQRLVIEGDDVKRKRGECRVRMRKTG